MFISIFELIALTLMFYLLYNDQQVLICALCSAGLKLMFYSPTGKGIYEKLEKKYGLELYSLLSGHSVKIFFFFFFIKVLVKVTPVKKK